jgi:tetratricopeptide (TPR) repeat protein
MSEERTEAYLNLINQLLSCNEGDETRILQENQELLDQGLVTELLKVADALRLKGDLNNANRLMNIAGNLLQSYSLFSTKTETTYLKFLMETLQKIPDNANPNPKVIYPFWEQNLDKLDDNLINILDSWATDKLTQITSEQAYSIAADNFCAKILYFSNLIQLFPLGKIAINKEIAIKGYEIVLTVVNFETSPKNWAMTQNNLAAAYLYRIKGNKDENLEKVIACCREALKVFTFDDDEFRQDWARPQNNLAIAYLYRIGEDKAENLETAIFYCQEALKVYTFEEFPEEWATTHNTLANAYSNRIKKNKEENLEKAIISYQDALKVFTCDDDKLRQDWAMIQNNLGNAYLDKIKENKEENLEKAISCFQKALKVRTFKEFPQDWAMTKNNLATAWEKVGNVEKAIAAYHSALTIYTKENDPLNCLLIADNLGNLHYKEKQWQPATEAYNIAIEAVESARLESLNPESRQKVLSSAIYVFHRIVQAYLHLNQPEKALEYIERSKGRNLVELMTQKNLQPQGISQEIIAQLNELKQRVISEQIRLQSQSINQNLRRSDNLNPYVQDHSYLKQYQQELEDFIAREIQLIDPIFSLTQKVEPGASHLGMSIKTHKGL